MTNLSLTCDGLDARTSTTFKPTRMVNLGYVGRDQAAVRAHLDELAHEGVPPPVSVPLFIPLPLHVLTTDQNIQVVGPSTSGEAEVVFLIDGPSIFIGIGSDHTDRALEKTSMAMSKAVCPNIIGTTVWKIEDVSDSWDDLILRSFVRRQPGDAEIPYQRSPLGTMMSASALIEFAARRLPADGRKGLVLYSGTIPTLTDGFVYGCEFRAELVDPRRGRVLSCSYQVQRVANQWDEVPALSQRA